MVFKYKSRVSLPVPAQKAGEALEAIRESRGSLTAKIVVDESRADGAPLHGCFEWDDATAAEKHREDQARYLLRSITVTFNDEPKTERDIRAFVHVEQKGVESYVPLSVAMGDKALRAQVVKRALEELVVWRERYRSYDELSELFIAIEQAEMVLV